MLKAGIEKRELGITPLPGGVSGMLFWSPKASSAGISVEGKGYFALEKRDYGYWEGILPGIHSGDRYLVVIDNDTKIPDPVSLSQPDGVHTPSEVIDTSSFAGKHQHWNGFTPGELIIYELHTGTFSPKGNFEGIIERLGYLAELGINAIEIMPVAQFPGTRNWGYDGVYPFAVQNSYGGPAEFARLVSECHKQNIAVILDVVYNHLGPEGNYLAAAGPYFTDKYKTPWGSAINFDDAWCDGVRRYFMENALMWLRDFGVDGLRIDAVHAVKDLGAKHFLAEMAENIEELNRFTGKNHFLIGECDLNDVRYITPFGEGGIGLDSQWCDEFHHALHAALTGEKKGYYSDFGNLSHLADSFNNAYVYNGKYSEHRKRVFGSSAEGMPGSRFVVFTQNHDQIGNRMLGNRLSSLTDFESLKLAAGAMFVSPFIPMLFMGEEYGEKAPFLYFTSHGDKKLIEAVREGRKKEFADFISGDGPPDPQSANTFEKSVLKWDFSSDDRKRKLLEFYKKLISLKKTHPALRTGSRENVLAVEAAEGKAIILTIAPGQPYATDGENIPRPAGRQEETADSETGDRLPGRTGKNQAKLTVIMNFADTSLDLPFAADSKGLCSVLLYSSHQQWGGPVNDFASLTVNKGWISMEPASIILFSDFQD